MEKLLTPRQVAELLEVRPRTLESWRVSGDGPPFVRVGVGSRGPVRYRRADLERWLAARVRVSTTGARP